MPALLEHANITVTDADVTANWMQKVFDWHIRWQGPSLDGGRSIHVGSDSCYIALYQPAREITKKTNSYVTAGGLNHLAVVVDDIDALEKAVIAAGFTPLNHAEYEPGKRFYFNDADDVEYEVVQYD